MECICYTKLMVKKYDNHVVWVNMFGAIGYLLLIVVWAFFVGIIVALSLQTGSPAAPVEVSKSANAGSVAMQPSVVLVAAGYVITALVVIGSLVVLALLPYWLAKWGGRWLRRMMRVFKVEPTRRYLFLTKSMLASVPLLGMTVINLILQPSDMAFTMVQIVSTGLAVLAISAFLVQLVLARRYNVPADQAW